MVSARVLQMVAQQMNILNAKNCTHKNGKFYVHILPQFLKMKHSGSPAVWLCNQEVPEKAGSH
jgi:hypothetical protein